MSLNLRNIYTTLFLIGIFFIPFNSFKGIPEFGEFKKESGSYFLLLGSLVLVIEWLFKNKIHIPYKSFIFQLVLIFLLWCFLSTLFNFPVVDVSYYKKTTGVNRFVRQYFALILSCIIFFSLYWNVILKMSNVKLLLTIRKVFLYSFIVVTVYGFFEILYLVFGFYPAYTVLRLFDYFPFTEYDTDINNRISSVCFEAPALATFLITVSGWMFSYIITHKGSIKYVPTVIVIILTYFSGSRTALIVVFVQIIVFLSIILSRRQKIQSALYSILIVFFFSIFIALSNGGKIVQDVEKKIESLDFKGNLKKNISNKSRFGIQYANLVVFSQNPIIGVGFGQQGFQALYYYPFWAKNDNYEFKQIYLNKKNPSFPPGYNLFVRLLAETGIIGFSIFLYLLYFVIKTSVRIIQREEGVEKTIAIVLLVTFVGFSLNWLQLDSFRMYGFWLCLAILIKLNLNLNEK